MNIQGGILEANEKMQQQLLAKCIDAVNQSNPCVCAVYPDSGSGKVIARVAGEEYDVEGLYLACIRYSGQPIAQCSVLTTSSLSDYIFLFKSTAGESEGDLILLASPDGQYIASNRDSGVSIYAYVQTEPLMAPDGTPARITAVGASTYPNRLGDPFACDYVAFTVDDHLHRPLVELFGRYYFRGAKPALTQKAFCERIQLEAFDKERQKFPSIGDYDTLFEERGW